VREQKNVCERERVCSSERRRLYVRDNRFVFEKEREFERVWMGVCACVCVGEIEMEGGNG